MIPANSSPAVQTDRTESSERHAMAHDADPLGPLPGEVPAHPLDGSDAIRAELNRALGCE